MAGVEPECVDPCRTDQRSVADGKRASSGIRKKTREAIAAMQEHAAIEKPEADQFSITFGIWYRNQS
jgi:hypothetical protein